MRMINETGSAQGGFTLLEVLVAMVVLSVGLLGLTGLQTTSLRSNHSAFLSSQATMVADQILDNMRMNRDQAVGGGYTVGFDPDGDGFDGAVCSNDCTAAEIAERDLVNWRAQVARLPAGEGSITVDANGVAEVTICWSDAPVAADDYTACIDDEENTTMTRFVTRAQL